MRRTLESVAARTHSATAIRARPVAVDTQPELMKRELPAGRTGRKVFLFGVASAVLVFAVGITLNVFRVGLAPDIHVDELIYTNAAQNLASGNGLSVQGQPFFWQPPLFFLLEWPVAMVLGLGHANTFDAVLQLRVLNGVLAAGTATLMFLLGWRVRGLWTGWLMAIFFVVDPFVLHLSRRLYIEPLPGFLIAAAILAMNVSMGRWTLRRRLFVGLLLGLAILSKELAAFALLVPVLMWARRAFSWKEPLTMAGTAVGVYTFYPLGAFLSGHITAFVDVKRFQFDHLRGLVHFSTFSRPGAALTQTLSASAGDYWPAYTLIALAIPAVLWLLLRRDRASQLLGCWALVTYAFIGILRAFSDVEDQFFYYLMLPVCAVSGFVLAELIGRLWLRYRPPAGSPRASTGRRKLIALAPLIAFTLFIVINDARLWDLRYVTGVDNGFSNLVASIARVVPPGSVIDSPGGSSEELKFAYPNGQYKFIQVRTPRALRNLHIQWYVLRSKDIGLPGGFGIDRRYYAYLTSRAVQIWSVSEHTYYDFGLWLVDDPSVLHDVDFPVAPPPRGAQPGTS
jgi:hypothetical protein